MCECCYSGPAWSCVSKSHIICPCGELWCQVWKNKISSLARDAPVIERHFWRNSCYFQTLCLKNVNILLWRENIVSQGRIRGTSTKREKFRALSTIAFSGGDRRRLNRRDEWFHLRPAPRLVPRLAPRLAPRRAPRQAPCPAVFYWNNRGNRAGTLSSHHNMESTRLIFCCGGWGDPEDDPYLELWLYSSLPPQDSSLTYITDSFSLGLFPSTLNMLRCLPSLRNPPLPPCLSLAATHFFVFLPRDLYFYLMCPHLHHPILPTFYSHLSPSAPQVKATTDLQFCVLLCSYQQHRMQVTLPSFWSASLLWFLWCPLSWFPPCFPSAPAALFNHFVDSSSQISHCWHASSSVQGLPSFQVVWPCPIAPWTFCVLSIPQCTPPAWAFSLNVRLAYSFDYLTSSLEYIIGVLNEI